MLISPSLVFTDTEELSGSLKHANVRAMQIERGSFEARLRQCQLGEWNFQYLGFKQGTSACSGDASPHQSMFLIPLEVVHGTRLLGRELTADGVGVYAPKGEHGDVTRAGMSEVIIAPPKDFLSAAQNEGALAVLPRTGSEYRSVPLSKLDHLRGTLKRIEKIPDPKKLSAPVRRTLIDLISTRFREAFSPMEAESWPGRVPMPRGPILRRISEEMNYRKGEIILASELAAAVGVSQPTLQRVFLEWHGLPPAKYLMLRRLYLARDMLRKGKHDSVSKVADECGFIEPSRFAKRYKAVFGELPSQTLRSRS